MIIPTTQESFFTKRGILALSNRIKFLANWTSLKTSKDKVQLVSKDLTSLLNQRK